VTSEKFAELFADVVFRSAISGTIGNLTTPPGRRPSSDLVRAAKWFAGFSNDDRAIAQWVIAAAAHAAAFGALAVIDGARPTGPAYYELVAVDAHGARTIVNPNARSLGEVFQSLVMEPDGSLIVESTRS
jgi:hypothetical protein